MKKLFLATAVVASIISSLASAKTQGDYFGFDVIKSSVDVKTSKKQSNNTNSDTYFNTKRDDSSFGIGLNYRHAINFGKAFIAPEVFLEIPGNETKVDDKVNSYQQTLKINARYGVRANFGYDVTDKFSLYVPLGLAINSYELKTNDYTASSYRRVSQKGSESSILYGIGASAAVSDNFLVNLEYNKSSFNIDSKTNVALVGDVKLRSRVDMGVLKLGTSYKF